MAEHQREPTMEEIAKMLDLKREDVVFAMDAIMDPVSLYEPVYSDGGDAICVMDQVSDTRNTDEAWTDRIALKEAMKRLDDRERRILSLRFYEGKTQMEVSAEVGISQAQVSRLEKGAINTIKKRLGLKSDKSSQNCGFKNWWTKSKRLEKPRNIKQNRASVS